MSEIPKVLVLGSITPTDKGDHLANEKLSSAVSKHKKHELARSHKFYETREGTLEEEEAARQLAMQYLLMTAEKEVTSDSELQRRVWSDRYTKASSEIYGTPDVSIAEKLAHEEYIKLLQYVGDDRVDQTMLANVLSVYETLANSVDKLDTQEDTNNDLETIALEVKDYLHAKYGEEFEVFDGEDDTQNSPAEIADKFTEALALLSKNNSEWLQWSVEIRDDKDSLSVLGGKEKKILVGAKRRSASNLELRGLFAHEVLVHAQRSVNGAEHSYELSSGLPGYLDTEEGLGTFFEYAITGILPQKNIDRYTDISFALGQSGSHKMPRSAMLEFVAQREKIRQQIDGNNVSVEEINKKTTAHVNRIYRGTKGVDGAVGVFTKDIAYHKGFIDILTYIDEQKTRGMSLEDILGFLLMGKFDPTDDRHVEYIESLQ